MCVDGLSFGDVTADMAVEGFAAAKADKLMRQQTVFHLHKRSVPGFWTVFALDCALVSPARFGCGCG